MTVIGEEDSRDEVEKGLAIRLNIGLNIRTFTNSG